MNSKRLWATTTATLFALSAVGPHSSGVWAQLSTTASCPTGWSWNQNSLGQDPCAISSALDAACRGVGSYAIPALNSTQNYIPPQKDSTSDLTCDCDTVMYSLYMACSTCQGGIIYSWTKWIAQCDTVYVTQYPHDLPYGAAIPHWAFYDVTTLPNQTYSDSVAMSVGRNPETTAKPLSTATVRTGTSSGSFHTTLTSSGTDSFSTGTSNTSTGSKLNITAIAAGAAGGAVFVALVALTALCLGRRRQSGGGRQPPLQPLPSQETSEYQKVPPMTPMLSPIAPNLPYQSMPSPNPYNHMPGQNQPPYNPSTSPNLPMSPPMSPSINPPMNPGGYYNPEDPTTFPPPMGDGQSSVTYTNPMPPGQGRYGGVPEV